MPSIRFSYECLKVFRFTVWVESYQDFFLRILMRITLKKLSQVANPTMFNLKHRKFETQIKSILS